MPSWFLAPIAGLKLPALCFIPGELARSAVHLPEGDNSNQSSLSKPKQRIFRSNTEKDIIRKIIFYSILFYSILFYSNLTYILFYSIILYYTIFYSILFYFILFYSILFYSILFYSILPGGHEAASRISLA